MPKKPKLHLRRPGGPSAINEHVGKTWLTMCGNQVAEDFTTVAVTSNTCGNCRKSYDADPKKYAREKRAARVRRPSGF